MQWILFRTAFIQTNFSLDGQTRYRTLFIYSHLGLIIMLSSKTKLVSENILVTSALSVILKIIRSFFFNFIFQRWKLEGKIREKHAKQLQNKWFKEFNKNLNAQSLFKPLNESGLGKRPRPNLRPYSILHKMLFRTMK